MTTSALSRILRRPNDYQSRSDFLLKLAADLYRDGNTYALAQRNDRFEVAALHPFDPKQSQPLVGAERRDLLRAGRQQRGRAAIRRRRHAASCSA